MKGRRFYGLELILPPSYFFIIQNIYIVPIKMGLLMVNKILYEKIYKELCIDFTSIDYLSKKLNFSKPYIWHQIVLLKALNLVEETYSKRNSRASVYRIKKEYSHNFEQFLKIIEGAL